ncbi:AmmeMemoRadiSam system protein B [Myxococcus sp. K15C18031901]|uniref:AmmeMemoRadiSam system protein B n=1 Tax=Myxococcus dinghuensis TaxID=2906761 RepID=UPI0020A7E589|nr:AmmeMemoRadiSam system protein B [Myxococcus dinghuensis]MCP3103062.1 AmmeMemoRadiSam system protein B [Myxococcus dinghuensis]
MSRVRTPAVAGSFYPANPSVLATQVDGWLDQAHPSGAEPPAALIVPHAGYRYSGTVAAAAYATLRAAPAARRVTRVLLLGPCHFLPLRGVVHPDVDVLCTPLGEVLVDVELHRRATALRQVSASREAHELEHSLEVQLPFLQRALGRFTVLPLLVGLTGAEDVAAVLDALWDGDVLPVVTSDLSHHLPYARARREDQATAQQVLALRAPLEVDCACGAVAISGLLLAARRRRLRPELLDLRSSGDASGEHAGVVGYGAFVFYPPTQSPHP